ISNFILPISFPSSLSSGSTFLIILQKNTTWIFGNSPQINGRAAFDQKRVTVPLNGVSILQRDKYTCTEAML
ncbi:MAG: hypothetical protein AAFN81_21265, partial [Bacteroidota bacterium]